MSDEAKLAESAGFDWLTRENFKSYVVRRIRSKNPKSSRMYLIEAEGRRAVVKDLDQGSFFFRNIAAPIIARREAEALRRLRGLDGVPRLFRLLDRRALVLSYVEGRPCSEIPQGELDAKFFDDLAALIRDIHARGVAHGDLKTAQNIIRRPDGRPCIVDFGAAFWPVPRWRVLSNYIYRLLRQTDWQGVYKLKRRHLPHLLTEEEREALECAPLAVRLAHAYRRVYKWLKQRRQRSSPATHHEPKN